jgi:membrane protein YdbS with pleckstrin-like domain
MASVSVDTAGAGAHQVDVPYLGRDVAEGLRTALLAQVAATEFRW